MKNEDNSTIYLDRCTGKGNYYTRIVFTRNDFFNAPILYKVLSDCIIFKHVPSEFSGKNKGGYVKPLVYGHQYKFTITGEDLPIGQLKIDEDYTEDELIVYFKQ